MNIPSNGQKIANQLIARLSLRTPQSESLDILVNGKIVRFSQGRVFIYL